MARHKVEDLKVIEVYNTQGKAAALETIRTTYGVKDAYYVLRRLKTNSAYTYDSKSDSFHKSIETPFMELEELCVESHENVTHKKVTSQPEKQIETQFDTYIQELIKERFMEYARFIQTNSIDRVWKVNKTALQAASYKLELY